MCAIMNCNKYGKISRKIRKISDSGEITTCHAEEAIIDRLMIQRASRVLIVADDSKIGRTGFSLVGHCDEKTEILTNKK